MATDKCPKCGAEAIRGTSDFTQQFWCCSVAYSKESFEQTETCRISELEAENAKLREQLARNEYECGQLEIAIDGLHSENAKLHAAGDGLDQACSNLLAYNSDEHDKEVIGALAAWHEAKGGGDAGN